MRILIIELEPTHYKTDLWNALVDSGKVDVSAVYTERRNWSPDGGHDYQRFPKDWYDKIVLNGKGASGALQSALYVLRKIRKMAPDLIYVAGYVHFQTVLAILYACLFGKRFAVHADVFNNGRPEGQFSKVKWLIREALRKLVFARAEAVLVCGRRGAETALEAGCPKDKIRDFPYSVSLARIQTDQPDVVVDECAEDIRAGRSIVLFSGRMIPRKGFVTLLQAMAGLETSTDWVLWAEGAGPQLQEYASTASKSGIGERCRFLGFCQYDLHSWLMRSAHIVVVPSLEDSWGIVVDEGLQLGKAVISSDATGSGYDRITHEVNGFVLPAGNERDLGEVMELLLGDRDLRGRMGAAAAASSANVTPKDNVTTLLDIAQVKQ